MNKEILKINNLDIQKESKWWDELILFLWGFLGLTFVSVILTLIFMNLEMSESMMTMLINFLSYVLLTIGFVIYLFLIRPGLGKIVLEGFKKSRFKDILMGYIIYLAFYYLLIIVYYIFVKIFNANTGDNANQSALIDISYYKVPFFLMTVVLAPICEELTYRVGLSSLLRRWNVYASVLLSGIIFGFIHFDFTTLITLSQTGDNTLLIQELWNLPPYIISGIALGAAYNKSGNFASSWVGHMLNNLIAALSILIGG